MRVMMQVGFALACAALFAWGYAALDGVRSGTAGAGSALAAELGPYPGADDIVARRIWAGDGVDVVGAPSPDGRWLSYVDWEGGGNLGIRDLRTGETRLLTEKEGGWASDEHALFSVFSPDGSRLVYQWWDEEASEYELRLVDLETRETRTIFSPGEQFGYAHPIGWMPTGDEVAVSHSGPDRIWQIGLIDVDKGSLRILRTLDWRGPRSAALSPDGEWIAYNLGRDDDPAVRDIFLIATDGSREVLLAGSDANKEVVGWLPDGGPLFYLSELGGTARVLAQDLDGARPIGPPRVVRSDLVNALPMGSFDGGFIFGIAVESAQAGVGSIDLQAGALTSPFITTSKSPMERATAAEWSRDGERLVYVVNPPVGGTFPVELAVRTVRTGAEQRFATSLGYVLNIDVSPDGRELLIQGYGPDGRNGLHRMTIGSLDVETLETVGVDADAARLPRWAADGRSAFYARWSASDGPVQRIVRRELASGELTPLLEVEGLLSFRISPNEREVAVVRRPPGSPDTELVVVDLATGEERELARATDPEAIRGASNVIWSPDGEHVLFLRRGTTDDGTEELRMIPRTGGEEKVVLTEDWTNRPRIHPDGTRIAASTGVNRWEVWTLENVRAAAADR